MKNTIIAVIIIASSGLVGFSIITNKAEEIAIDQNVSPTTNYAKTNKGEYLRQATLKIDGMFCVSCAIGAEYALKEKEGVIDASVDYYNENGKVIYDPLKISKDEIIQAVKPYTATITEDILFK